MITETIVLTFQTADGRTRTRKATFTICDHDPKHWRKLLGTTLSECTKCYTMSEVGDAGSNE